MSSYLTILEVVKVPVVYKDQVRVITRSLRRASGVEVGSVEKGKQVANEMFEDMKDDLWYKGENNGVQGQLVGEITTLSFDDQGRETADTLEFDFV